MNNRTCSIDGCEKPVRARGWCGMHYMRWLRTGDPGEAKPERGDPGERPLKPHERACSIEGCGRPVTHRGFCGRHYQRWRKTGDPLGIPKPPKVCSIEGCGRKHYGRGWCLVHWTRWSTHGDPLVAKVVKLSRSATAEDRFWYRVDKNGPIPDYRPDLGPCWLWIGSVNQDCGYGYFSLNGETALAHRVAYEWLVDEIPADRPQLDHLCRVRHCVNPAHLEPVTSRENTIRGIGPELSRRAAETRTECAHGGHPWIPENIFTRADGVRGCILCRRAREKKRRARRRAARRAG